MGDKFRINRPADHQGTLRCYAPEQRCHSWNDRATGPESGDNIGINSGSHRFSGSSSRMLRTHSLISAIPPGKVPKAPAYFSKGFPAGLAGRMSVSLPRTTNSTRSPTLKPKRARIFFGTVTCPLVLMTLEFAIFLTLHPYSKDINPYISGQTLPECAEGGPPCADGRPWG